MSSGLIPRPRVRGGGDRGEGFPARGGPCAAAGPGRGVRPGLWRWSFFPVFRFYKGSALSGTVNSDSISPSALKRFILINGWKFSPGSSSKYITSCAGSFMGKGITLPKVIPPIVLGFNSFGYF